MCLAVTIGAQQVTLIQFVLDQVKPGVSLARYRELLGTQVSMVELQCIEAAVVAASLTSSAFVRYRFCFVAPMLPTCYPSLAIFAPA
jgi:hypothetical protein